MAGNVPLAGGVQCQSGALLKGPQLCVTHAGAGTPQRDGSLGATHIRAGTHLSVCSLWRTDAGAENKHQETKSSRGKLLCTARSHLRWLKDNLS